MTLIYRALHFTFEASGMPASLLEDIAWLKEAMEDIVSLFGMTPIPGTETIAVKIEDNEKAWGSGVSIIIPLSDSHLALHTLSEKSHLYFDFFSCKPFPHTELSWLLQRIFKPAWTRSGMVDRTITSVV